MSINPNSTIHLYAGVPLDSTYTDTIDFASVSAQNAYFSSLAPVKTFQANTYQRVNEGVFRAQCVADEVYSCNYMRFQNTAYGSKWFYAFIDAVEYVNDGTCQITFTLDVMQSHFFSDCELEQSFVERHHPATDEIGDNLQPEPVALGEVVFDDYHELTGELDEMFIIVAICDVSGSEVKGNLYDRNYGGAELFGFATSQNGIALCNRFLASYIQRPESIVSIYMCPAIAFGFEHVYEEGDEGGRIPYGARGKSFLYTDTRIKNLTDFDGYQPANKKLFTYPYNYVSVDDGNGSSLQLRYEFFENQDVVFRVQTNITNPVQVKLTPFGYKGTGNTHLLTEFLTIGGYPLCSWNNDTYRAWLAQNTIPMVIQLGVGAVSLVAGAVTGGLGLAAGAATMASMAGSVLSQNYEASTKADICKGNISSGNVTFSAGDLNFHVARARITREQAIVIDNYFKMFGYAINKVYRPSTRTRPHYTYIKTIGCKLKGNCPNSVIKKISEIFDAGITFWRNASEIGNYSLDNRPTT